MVISDVVICNFGLNLLGVEEISSLNEASRAATVCKTAYSLSKEALLRSHFWSFAKKRVLLTPDATPPAFDYSYQFTIPSDAVVWRFIDCDEQVVQEGRKLLTNASTLKLVYVSNTVSEADFDPIFSKALSIRIAADTCHKLTQNVSLGQKLEEDFSKVIAEAKRMNAISQSPEGLVISTFTTKRL